MTALSQKRVLNSAPSEVLGQRGLAMAWCSHVDLRYRQNKVNRAKLLAPTQSLADAYKKSGSVQRVNG